MKTIPLPKFFGVGAPKSGTTSLHDILIQHPQIFLPRVKETNFFLIDELYNKGIDFYKKTFFSEWNGEKVVGEINPSYMFDSRVIKRIYNDVGKDVKLFFIFRNPVDRAYSHYWMNFRRGFEKKPFEDAIRKEKENCDFNSDEKLFCYLRKGLYSVYVKKYLEYFPKKNMFFIIFETDFLKEKKKTIENLLNFLGVDNFDLNLNVKSNPNRIYKSKFVRELVYGESFLRKIGKKLIPNVIMRKKIKKWADKLYTKPFTPPQLDKELRKELLRQYFLEDIKELESILNRDLSVWYGEI